MKRTLLFFLTSLLFISLSFATDKGKQTLKNKIENILKWEEQFGFSGSVMVVKDGKIILNKGYGFANRAHYAFNTPRTAFYIASVSKPITALAVMKLVEEKRISLQDPLTKFFSNVPDNKKGITVGMLLTHTSGMVQTYSCDKISDRELAIATILGKTPMQAKPGERYIYSGDGYSLLAAMIEIVTGYKFETYVDETIFKPADVNTPAHTGRLSLLKHEDIATPAASSTWKNLRQIPATWGHKGRAGMILSVEDLYKIDKALEGHKIFRTDIIKDILTSKTKIGSGDNYGYGFHIWESVQGTKFFGHGGDDDAIGHNAVFLNYPEEKVKIFIGSNSGLYINSSWSNVIASMIQRVLFPSGYSYDNDKLYHTEFAKQSLQDLEKLEGVYQSGSTRHLVWLNGEQLVMASLGTGVAQQMGFPEIYSSRNELTRSIIEETYKGEFTLLRQYSPNEDVFERMKRTLQSVWTSSEKSFGKFESLEVMGTANTWSGSHHGDIATWIQLSFKNRRRVYRLEWDVNNKIATLGGGAIPYPMIFTLNPIARKEFIGFDPGNGKTVSVNFLTLDENDKAIMELNIGKNKPVLQNNTGDMKLLPKRSAAELIYQLMRTKGIAAAREEMALIKAGKSDRFSLDDADLNDYGYRFLKDKKFDEAIAMFTILVEEFPAEANGFDSLGEAYLKAGNKEQALKNYKRSVELNPNNENAKKIIGELQQ